MSGRLRRIRGLRITVWDVLSWLAAGMTEQQILEDYSELEPDDSVRSANLPPNGSAHRSVKLLLVENPLAKTRRIVKVAWINLPVPNGAGCLS